MKPVYNIKNVASKKYNFLLFFTHLKIRLPKPVVLVIHITSKCTKNCNWCYQKYTDFYSRHSGDMSIDEFEKVINSFNGILWPKPHLHLSGGEPMAHPQFPEFLKICKRYNCCLTITTNGELLKEYLNIIKNSSLNQLNISIPEPRNPYCLESDYNLLISNIQNLTKVKTKVINLNYVITPTSYMWLEKITTFFDKNLKNTIAVFGYQHLMFENGNSAIGGKEINIDILSRQIESIKRTKLNFPLTFTPEIKTTDLYKYYYSDAKFVNKCYIPWFGLSIYPDLTVTPVPGCLHCESIVGNLQTQSINEVWHGEKLLKFQNDLVANGLSKRCNRCCHKIYY